MEVTALVDDVDDTVSDDVTVPVVSDQAPDVLETRSMQRSRILASTRSSSSISRSTLDAPAATSTSGSPSRPRRTVDGEEPSPSGRRPGPSSKLPELSDGTWVLSDISGSSGGDMLHPLLLLLLLVVALLGVFDEALLHVAAVAVRGINSHSCSACQQYHNDPSNNQVN